MKVQGVIRNIHVKSGSGSGDGGLKIATIRVDLITCDPRKDFAELLGMQDQLVNMTIDE